MYRPVTRIFAAATLCLSLAGCSHLHRKPADQYVYVTAKEAPLRDRIAAVSNRTGTVTNGEKLVVLERSRRFVKVKTPSGAVGWMEERLTADQALADKFDQLSQQHAHDPVIAGATARDDVYMHIAPGRETDHFYRLNEDDSMDLLQRAVVAKPVAPGAQPLRRDGSTEPAGPPPPTLEDWWLARQKDGHTGWVYGHMIDINAPDAIQRYAEGQRIVGAYVLAKVNDPDSGMLNNGNPVTEIPEYVALLSSWKSGLPYDFDQVRVFTWNTRKHRYETAFRDRNIEGYLPIKLFTSKDPYGKSVLASQMLPTFQYNVLAADAPTPQPDPTTGLIKPAKVITKTYRLEETICHRILPPGQPPPDEAHPEPEKEKAKLKTKHRR